MNRRLALSVLAGLGWYSRAPLAHAAGRIAVIVHKQNEVTRLSEDELEAIFTTRRVHWSGSDRIAVFNYPPKDPLRVAFDRAVLHMDPDEVARYWIDRRMRGGHRPPRQVGGTPFMLRVVAKLQGAIGYVPAKDVDDTVRVVAEVDT